MSYDDGMSILFLVNFGGLPARASSIMESRSTVQCKIWMSLFAISVARVGAMAVYLGCFINPAANPRVVSSPLLQKKGLVTTPRNLTSSFLPGRQSHSRKGVVFFVGYCSQKGWTAAPLGEDSIAMS